MIVELEVNSNSTCNSLQNYHHHHHLEIYSAPITFAAIGAVQKSYKQQFQLDKFDIIGVLQSNLNITAKAENMTSEKNVII